MVKERKQVIKLDAAPNGSDLSMERILASIANTINKEKTKGHETKSENDGEILCLEKGRLISGGCSNFGKPMSKDLATLKAFIQNVVYDEIRRLNLKVNDRS